MPAATCRRRGPVAGLVLALVLALLLAGCGGTDSDGSPASSAGPDAGNPFAQKAQTVDPDPLLVAGAKQAAADGDDDAADVLHRIADVPQGIWLTPEQYPVDQVGQYVSSVVAGTQGTTVPVFVIYGIPDRDCTGGYSAGGLTDATYRPWVEAIATAAGSGSVAVVEPDALAGAVACHLTRERVKLVGEAVAALHATGTTAYVDAGHSDWVPAAQMARLLQQADVSSARGFSTNVANYQPTSAEKAYAAALSRRLDDAHFVIDTSRNGASSASGDAVSDWCNPSGQALGQQPGYVSDGSGLDAVLWIKPPAESDGTCHGGPDAGELWLRRAVALGEAAGW